MKNLSLLIVALVLTMTSGCSGAKRTAVNESAYVSAPEAYHADNDIAMTVRSLVDALNVGEKLDSADYDFKGVLTDGTGRPLYTNLQGIPGQWEVDVTSPTSAVIRNTHIGDLLPWDLESYLVQSLNTTDNDVVKVEVGEEEDPLEGDTIHRAVYDFGGGYLRIETRKVIAAEGIEGAVMNITTAKSIPLVTEQPL